MLKNFLTIAFRNLVRHKGFSIINIFGLAIGITCCIIVSLFIKDELSYDKQNDHADRIYRVVKNFVNDDGSSTPDATTSPAIAAAIQKDIPEIEYVAKLFPKPWGNNFYVRYGEKKFMEENIYHADASLFDVFSFPFIKGDPKTALNNPNAIVLTESTAKKYFGNENPLGKRLEVDDWAPCVVTAVIKDIPANAHFSFDILVPLTRFMNDPSRPANTFWGWYSFYTYIKLKPGADIAAVDKKIRGIFKKNQPQSKDYFYSQPLTSIHLTSNLHSELKPNSDKIYSWIFGTIALFILLIACINYINLTTARFSLRAKEIGIRKVAGATKPALIRQFLSESVLLSLLASVVAIILAQLILPEVNIITNKQLVLMPGGNMRIPCFVFFLTIVVGVLAGLYPAVYLSSFQPAKVLKGEKLAGAKNISFRKILVVTQFSIFMIMITGTITIIQQVNFIQNSKLGLDKNHVIVVNDIAYLNGSEKTMLKNEFLQVPGVKTVAAADGVPGGVSWTRNVRYKGSQSNQLINTLSVDEDFTAALGMEIKEGRNFYHSSASDTSIETILNETAARELGIPAPFTGQQIIWNEDQHAKQKYYATIVGIVKDFHFASMKNEIKPFVFVANKNRRWNYTIKLSGANIGQAIAGLKKIWDKNIQARPFQYAFLDETYAKLYASEMNFKQIFTWFTFVAIFIACLGLLGLSAFISEQRTKEIGIRKILGASVADIAVMLSANFVRLIAIASVISFPVAWWTMHIWLRNFAYRIDISWWTFPAATSFGFLTAIITIGFHAIKAAIANPVKSLRAE
jgi:putative ABC transport system permease protein